MGGYGSGRSHGGRPTTSDCRALDIRRLRQRGRLEPGQAFAWQWSSNGTPLGSIGIWTERDRILLKYRHQPSGKEWQEIETPIRLDFTKCNLGGNRCWFRCPIWNCGSRVAVLYMGSKGLFACRRCYRLCYESQRENYGDRATRRADKIRERLGWFPGILSGDGPKPRGMHWRTFNRLVDQHDEFVNVSMCWAVRRFGADLLSEFID